MTAAITLHPERRLSLETLRALWMDGRPLALGEDAVAAIGASAALIAERCDDDVPIYGVNTGFGLLANTRIPGDRLAELQTHLLRSHAAGVGPALPAAVVSLMLALKAASLARGYSGVRPALVELLVGLYNRRVLPRVPAQGSVGASGDLAPLAHMAAIAIGEGEADHDGRRLPAGEALAAAGLAPLALAPKEGLALVNGTQASTALALHALFLAERVFAAACVAGALSVDALKASDTPFEARIQHLRGHPGQARTALLLSGLLAGSDIRASHVDCDRVQDPYSIRCQSQVLGACLEQMGNAARLLVTEANAVTDNPLVFAETGEVLSGGNFHAEPVAFAADGLALAIAEIGAIAERRVALMIDPKMSGLPPFLVEDSGLNSGFMLAQVTAAALASENKSLAHPASVDSLPTSANQEDHVSMATYAARRLDSMLRNTAAIVAIELMAAAQGIEFHRPHRSSDTLERALECLRGYSAHYDEDRALSGEIERLRDAVLEGEFQRFLPAPGVGYGR